MPHANPTPVFTVFVHRHEQRKLLVCITSNKLFHSPPQLLPRLGSAYLTAEPRCGAFIRSLTSARLPRRGYTKKKCERNSGYRHFILHPFSLRRNNRSVDELLARSDAAGARARPGSEWLTLRKSDGLPGMRKRIRWRPRRAQRRRAVRVLRH